MGIEREKEYVALALKRLELAEENREIQGYENGIFRARNGWNIFVKSLVFKKIHPK